MGSIPTLSVIMCFYSFLTNAICNAWDQKMNFLQEIDKLISWEKENFDYLPLVTIDFGMALCEELKRCEPFQRLSIYDDNYSRFFLVKRIYDKVCNRYPITMQIAIHKFVSKTITERNS